MSRRPGDRFVATFAVVSTGVALVNLDLFVVNVALPEIGRALGAELSALSWVINGYAIVFAALLVPAGRVADRTSRRTGFLAGVALFAAASAVCAASGSIWLLVTARAAQAVGGALLIPSSLGLLLAAAPPDKRVGAVRSWTAVAGVAAALGPVIGGGLVAADWRWVFLVNVPIAVLAIVAGLRVLPKVREEHAGVPLDGGGAVVLVAAIGLLAFGLVKAADRGWGSVGVIAALVAGVGLLGVILATSARRPASILDPRMLRIPAFRIATAANVVFAIAFAAMLLSLTLWCQLVWHWSAVRTGLAISPGPLAVPFLAIWSGPLARRLGHGLVAALGCVLFACGAVEWLLVLSLNPRYATGLLPGLLLTGMGVGLALPTLVGAAAAAIPPTQFATGSGVVTMARQLGTVLGVALLVAFVGSPATPLGVASHYDNACIFMALVAVSSAAISLVLGKHDRSGMADIGTVPLLHKAVDRSVAAPLLEEDR